MIEEGVFAEADNTLRDLNNSSDHKKLNQDRIVSLFIHNNSYF